MKLLVLLNENPAGAHDDVHRALENCYDKGIITDKFIYPFLARLTECKKEKEVLKEIVEISKNYQPDLILWMHTDKFKIKQDTIKVLRSLKNKPVMGYWEGDLYQSPFRPITNELLKLYANCDVVFVPGFGEMTNKMKKNGCKDIRYVPLFGDDKRFYPIKNLQKKEYDIVMIGNNVKSRNPFRRNLPAMNLRANVINNFSLKYQNRFAIFGLGWKGNSAKGPVAYLDQHKIYSKSRIAISVNNADAKYYFSDRLPIAMLSAIPIVHNYEEGFDKMFDDCNGLKFFKSINEALQVCEELLKKSDDELSKIGNDLLDYALKKFKVEFVFEYMINVLKEIYFLHSGNELTTNIQNPWLKENL